MDDAEIRAKRAATGTGAWLVAASGLVGLCLSLFYYFVPHIGIDHSGGALLVFVSTALILAAMTRSWPTRCLELASAQSRAKAR